MGALETATKLATFESRGPGTDAERRAALWLQKEIRARGRDVTIEPFWCRPHAALAQAWHVGLGLAGSLIAVSHPKVGGATVLVALLLFVADAITGRSPGRLLTFERASQNVVSSAAPNDTRVRLLVTAGYDAGHAGLVYRHGARRIAAQLRRAAGRAAPGWEAWTVLSFIVLIVVALKRNSGDLHSVGVVALQLIPTLALVLEFALLIELAIAEPGPGANDTGTAAGIAVALVQALDSAPPAHVAVELVLAGAADGGMIGLRRYLRAHRPRAGDVVVLGIGPCGAGTPRWWASDGALVPLRYFPQLQRMCAKVASEEAYLGAHAHRGRGQGPALPARAAGLPAITIGCLDLDGLAPRSHTEEDTAASLDPQALDAAIAFARAVVDAIDSEVGHRAPARAEERRRAAERAAGRHRRTALRRGLTRSGLGK